MCQFYSSHIVQQPLLAPVRIRGVCVGWSIEFTLKKQHNVLLLKHFPCVNGNKIEN